MAARLYPLYYRRWWDASLNVVSGCAIADTSCAYCYVPWRAAGIQTETGVALYIGVTKFEHGRWTWNGETTELAPDHPTWTFPLDWKGSAEPLLGAGKPSLIFLNSMADLFYPAHRPEAVHRILENTAHSRHIGLVLTKYPRPPMEAYFRDKPAFWRRRIWLGFSAGDQLWFERRWALMRPLAERGWLVFVSLQPLLAPVRLPPDFLVLARWVLVGGEQAPGNREMDLDWARSIRDQCVEAGLPVFIKQRTRGWLPPDLSAFAQLPKV